MITSENYHDQYNIYGEIIEKKQKHKITNINDYFHIEESNFSCYCLPKLIELDSPSKVFPDTNFDIALPEDMNEVNTLTKKQHEQENHQENNHENHKEAQDIVKESKREEIFLAADKGATLLFDPNVFFKGSKVNDKKGFTKVIKIFFLSNKKLNKEIFI